MTDNSNKQSHQSQSDAGAEASGGWLDTSLIGIEGRSIRRLSGFVRGRHHLPTRADLGSDAFVTELAQEERENEIAEIHRSLRQHFGLRRRELNCDADSISCPGFQYYLSVQVDPDDPRRALFWRELSEISDPQLLMHPSFPAIFADRFDKVQVRHKGELNMEDLVDHMEDVGLQVDYPPNLQHLSLILPTLNCELRMESRSVTVTSIAAADELSLVERFMAAALHLEERGVAILPRVQAS